MIPSSTPTIDHIGNLARFDLGTFQKPDDARQLVDDLMGAAGRGCGESHTVTSAHIIGGIVNSYLYEPPYNPRKLYLLWDELLERYDKLLREKEHFYVNPGFMAVQIATAALAGACIGAFNLRGERNALLPIPDVTMFSDPAVHRANILTPLQRVYEILKASHNDIVKMCKKRDGDGNSGFPTLGHGGNIRVGRA